MRPLFSLILFLLLLGFLLAFIQVGLLTIAFDKLGLSPSAAFLLLIGSLIGSTINLPLFQIRADAPIRDPLWQWRQLLGRPPAHRPGYTVVAINVGGCIIPILFSLYLLTRSEVGLLTALFGITAVTVLAHLFSRPIPGVGIGMPLFVAPVGAALAALLLDPQQSAPLAYISGTLGVLTGADLLRLKEIRRLGTPIASIGGAGTFDGIFITGIVAVLLA